jgi:hypothetical protein
MAANPTDTAGSSSPNTVLNISPRQKRPNNDGNPIYSESLAEHDVRLAREARRLLEHGTVVTPEQFMKGLFMEEGQESSSSSAPAASQGPQGGSRDTSLDQPNTVDGLQPAQSSEPRLSKPHQHGLAKNKKHEDKLAANFKTLPNSYPDEATMHIHVVS